tara:strand:+ start:828 stop:1094 length:267 start_codon:yes stop_codon:yes gene_type:complete
MDILIKENRTLHGKKVSMTKEQKTRLHNYLHKYFSDFWQDVTPNYKSFIDDKEKMIDFYILSKQEFLQSYSYLTELEYDLTAKEQTND